MSGAWGRSIDQSGDRQLCAELNAEWRRLVHTERTVLLRWGTRRPCLERQGSGPVSLDTLIADGRHRDDEVLGALLGLTAEGEDLAGRVVLQALLASMVRMAARDPGAGLSDYVSHLWCRIRTYPLERRPRRIANNLELDTLKAICRERPRHVLVPAGLEELELLMQRECRGDDPEPEAPDVIRAGVAAGLIDRPTAAVLTTVYAEGLTGRQAAERHALSVDTVRWRCSRGLRTLAQHRDVLAAVA